MYYNKEVCTKCQGACCKASGCMLSTRDCEKEGIEKKLKQLIEEQVISIYAMPTQVFMFWLFSTTMRKHGMDLNKLIPAMEQLEKIANRLYRYPEVFMVKMRSVNRGVFETINDMTQLGDLIISGPCVKLTSTGCEYSDNERPYGGKSLKPDERGIKYCTSDYSTIEMVLEWYEHHVLIEKLRKEYS